MCAETIPLAARICEYCDARFEVTGTGYCQTCHDVREADGNGQCKVCGKAVVDLRVESRLIEGPVQESLPVSQPTAQNERPITGKRRLFFGILAGILSFAIIGAFFWFGRNSIPAVSDLLESSTPNITMTLTPTTALTSTPDLRRLNPANQHQYKYVKENRSWRSANQYCVEQDGHLVTIQDETENQYVYMMTHGNTWLGATDEIYEESWVWVSDEPWQYTNWRSGQPDNNHQTENYLTYYETKPSWNDIGDFKMFFVCEWEP